MRTKLRYWLIAVCLLAGQTLSLSLAGTHDLDPEHADHECYVCLTATINDTAPPDPNRHISAPTIYYWSVGDIQSHNIVVKALSGAIRVRAPPQ